MEIISTSFSRFEPSFNNSIKNLDHGDGHLHLQDNESSDKISVSRDAMLLTEALRSAQTAPDCRNEKIAVLRAQVTNDTYRPDSMTIAHALLRDEREIFGV